MNLEKGIVTLKEAITIRAKITELYKMYHSLSNTACFAASLTHRDLKRAVDAIHYLGGGWPSPTSKGRMEALLDNFVQMYRILDFIGSGNLVTDHLAKYGVSIKMEEIFKIKNRKLEHNEKEYLKSNYSSTVFHPDEMINLSDLVNAVIMECNDLQSEICELADIIKDELKPSAKEELEIDDPEYDRLHDIIRLEVKNTEQSKKKVLSKKVRTNSSFSHYNKGLAILKHV